MEIDFECGHVARLAKWASGCQANSDNADCLFGFASDSDGQQNEKMGNRIRELREERTMSLEDLAHAVGVSPSYLSRMETGKRQIAVSRLPRFAKALGVKPGDLVSDRPSVSAQSHADRTARQSPQPDILPSPSPGTIPQDTPRTREQTGTLLTDFAMSILRMMRENGQIEAKDDELTATAAELAAFFLGLRGVAVNLSAMAPHRTHPQVEDHKVKRLRGPGTESSQA